jgi:hypothetical protein
VSVERERARELVRRSGSERGREREKPIVEVTSEKGEGNDKAIGQQGSKGLNTKQGTYPSSEKFQRPEVDFRGGGL